MFFNKSKQFYLDPFNVREIRFGKNSIEAEKIPRLESAMDPNLICYLPRSSTGKGHDKWIYFSDPSQIKYF